MQNLSLKEYLVIAQKCIKKFAKYNVASMMLKDDDAISFVAEKMMWGDVNWDSTRGRTQRSYRNQCAIWGINKWIYQKTLQYKQKRFVPTFHLYDMVRPRNYNLSYYLKIFKAKTPVPIESTEMIQVMLNSNAITPKQSQILKMRFFEHSTFEEIATALQMTKQGVHESFKKALHHLNQKYKHLDIYN